MKTRSCTRKAKPQMGEIEKWRWSRKARRALAESHFHFGLWTSWHLKG